MSRLRIRMELNRGGVGVPLHKLASVVDEAQKFFRMLGEDVRIESWVENHHPSTAIRVAAFEGPKVAFGRTPVGLLPNWHPTYTAAGGPGANACARRSARASVGRRSSGA